MFPSVVNDGVETKSRRRRERPERWRERLDRCLLRDARRLARAADRQSPPVLAAALTRAEARAAERAASLPSPRFDADLPILALREELVAGIARHQVLIVCGATGSGKSTQLPQLALAAGRGRRGYIGHTQPRRIAASALARRIAAELGSDVGAAVGYKIRFRDRVSPRSAIKLMTDGILLAEIHSDPELLAYDTLILDEAHERSLNIDFLLGYLKRLLPRRPDLRLVVTSATIEPARYAKFFSGAPVLEVPGRTYPIEIRYRPPVTGQTIEEAIADNALSLVREAAGDVLAFLPGEREIGRAATLLKRGSAQGVDVLPLYARLPRREQDRIFAPGGTGSRVILATNIAETSLTVPGIRYVVDAGLARIARYAPHAAVQRLPIEPISQASAEQRKGRAGRTAPGVCIRLYEEADLIARARSTPPEIQRTGLDGVLLRMAALGLGSAEDFPFLDPPPPKALRAGYRDLSMLGAFDAERGLTSLGARLARLPLDPRLARILLEAVARGVYGEALTVVSALSIPDPRERSVHTPGSATEAHGEFAHPDSDFLSDLALWRWYREAGARTSRRGLDAELRRRFLSPARMREWRAVREELRRTLAAEGIRESRQSGDPAQLHRAVLAGFLDRVAMLAPEGDGHPGAYITTRGKRVDLFPASALARRRPRLIVAAELIETSRVFAHHAAAVRPEWVEEAGAHLLQRRVDRPYWDQQAGRVLAEEETSLLNLVLASGRKVDFSRFDSAGAREIFIREGLVGNRFETRSRGVNANRRRVRELEREEERARRRDILADASVLEAFYAERIPAEVHDAAGFEKWVAAAERVDRSVLLAPPGVFERNSDSRPGRENFPERLDLGPLRLPVRYRFTPGAEDDGLTVAVPVAGLEQIDEARVEWLVPGLLEEKIEALVRTLPKAERRRFVPAREFARALGERLQFGEGDLLVQVSRELGRLTGSAPEPSGFRPEALSPHLRLRFELLDDAGKAIAAGRDLAALRAGHGGARTSAFAALAPAALERDRVEGWNFDELPERVVLDHGSGLGGYPALVAEGDGVALRVLASLPAAERSHRAGVVALARRSARAEVRELERSLPLPGVPELARLGLERGRLVHDFVDTVLSEHMLAAGLPRSAQAFESSRSRAVRALVPEVRELAAVIAPALRDAAAAHVRLAAGRPASWQPAVADMRAQLSELFQPGFVNSTPGAYRHRLCVYVAALARRLERLEENPARDSERSRILEPLAHRLRRASVGGDETGAAERQRARVALEELRIQLFAQELGTQGKVSPRRVERLFDELGL